MSEDMGINEVNFVIKLFELGKKGIAEFNSRGSTGKAKSFLNIDNNKREKFKRKSCDIPFENIHSKIEESVQAAFAPVDKKTSKYLEQEKIENKKIILHECFKSFSPKETYAVSYKKKKAMSIDSLFFEDTKYREEFQFISKYITPSLKVQVEELGTENLSEENFLTILDSIINKYLFDSIDLKTIILSGNIGTGKTTVFAKTMQYFISHNNPSNAYYLLPINIDFEKLIEMDDRQSQTTKHYVDSLLNKINSRIQGTIDKTKKTKEAKTKRIVPIIFFDNLDLVYQKFCEDYFITPYGIKFIDIFLSVVRNILDTKQKSILICGLREESLNAIKDRRFGDKKELDKLTSLIIEVKRKTPDEIKEIIEKRLKLVCDGFKLAGFGKEEISIVKSNMEEFKNTQIDFEELDGISSEGLRNTIDLFLRVAPSLLNSKMFHRFFIDNYYIKKMHLMGDTNIYTQAGNGIFNIFLNNTKFRYLEDAYKYEDSYISTHSSSQVRQLASITYIQTYWAKYFILLYLYQEKIKSSIAPSSVDALINFFSKNATTERYEENLVRLILLGLSESRHGKIIDIILNNGDMISRFSLSDRGKYIVENHIWTFDYLSVVVDDIWLEYPDFILERFDFLQTIEPSYCHLNNKTTFETKRKEALIKKIKKVKLFLEILKISYEYENKKVRRIVAELKIKTKSTDIFMLPNFNDIERKVYKTIKEYSKICGITLEGELSLHRDILNSQEIKELRIFFKENYALGLAFNKNDVMNYHNENIKKVSNMITTHEDIVPVVSKETATLFDS